MVLNARVNVNFGRKDGWTDEQTDGKPDAYIAIHAIPHTVR